MTDDEQQQQSKRPSFTSFWKKGKEKLKGKEITFVQQQTRVSESSQSPESSGKSPDSEQQQQQQQQHSKADKAKVRRAQVRRAQIQHRQRKAEYVKQLELDASHYRELVSFTESEVEAYRRENEAMRLMLQGAGVATGSSSGGGDALMTGYSSTLDVQASPNPATSFDEIFSAPLIDEDVPELFADINIDDIVVTLKDDDVLGTPSFQISPSPESQSRASPAAAGVDGITGLTPEQEQVAVNFILALEHICWDHFYLGDFVGHTCESNVAMGHGLMASTICMSSAPEHAFMGRRASPKGVQCSKTHVPKGTPVDFQWAAPGISLKSLHGLASSLNPGDKELTPVQAWFELARRYPVGSLMDRLVIDALKVQLNGVVKCLKFGAVMEREAFESVVGRVLGPAAPGW